MIPFTLNEVKTTLPKKTTITWKKMGLDIGEGRSFYNANVAPNNSKLVFAATITPELTGCETGYLNIVRAGNQDENQKDMVKSFKRLSKLIYTGKQTTITDPNNTNGHHYPLMIKLKAVEGQTRDSTAFGPVFDFAFNSFKAAHANKIENMEMTKPKEGYENFVEIPLRHAVIIDYLVKQKEIAEDPDSAPSLLELLRARYNDAVMLIQFTGMSVHTVYDIDTQCNINYIKPCVRISRLYAVPNLGKAVSSKGTGKKAADDLDEVEGVCYENAAAHIMELCKKTAPKGKAKQDTSSAPKTPKKRAKPDAPKPAVTEEFVPIDDAPDVNDSDAEFANELEDKVDEEAEMVKKVLAKRAKKVGP